MNKHRSWTPGLREANLLIYFGNLADNRGPDRRRPGPHPERISSRYIKALRSSELGSRFGAYSHPRRAWRLWARMELLEDSKERVHRASLRCPLRHRPERGCSTRNERSTRGHNLLDGALVLVVQVEEHSSGLPKPPARGDGFRRITTVLVVAFRLPLGAPLPSAPPCIRHLRRPVTCADLDGTPDLVLAPQRLTCDTSAGCMGLSVIFRFLPVSA